MRVELLNEGIPGYVSAGIHPMQSGKSWHEWRTSAINRVFGNQGVRGASEPGITAETIRDAEAQVPVETVKLWAPKVEQVEEW